MYETVFPMPYAGLGAYEIHERVAGLMNRTPRDYLYEFCVAQGALYLRSPVPATLARPLGRPPEEGISWRELVPLASGARYKLLGRIALDYSRLMRAKVTSYTARRSDFAKVLAPLLAERVGLIVESLEVWTDSAVGIRKPGRGQFHFLPVNMVGRVEVANLELARAAHERGFGRARGFGFGVLHFRPLPAERS